MDEELRKKVEQYIREQERLMNRAMNGANIVSGNPSSGAIHATGKAYVEYSLAEVQLVSGDMIGMTVTASPTVSKHLMESMKGTGFLHLFNTEESLMIRASDVRAIKLTKITKE
jgi:hypothetical protein